ncbi:MAG: seryl-tRNA synthetase, partial [Acidimicrobiaceae bacterium]|nr:seryl-tRNA synthetase [Acidimicrobiaceae bacterium]
MIDVRRLRDDLDSVRRALARRGIDLSELDRAADLDRRHRTLVMRRDELRGRKNTVSKDIGAARRAGEADRAFALTGESTAVGEELDQVEAATVAAERELSGLLLRIPNLPADDAPDGASEADNPVLRV